MAKTIYWYEYKSKKKRAFNTRIKENINVWVLVCSSETKICWKSKTALYGYRHLKPWYRHSFTAYMKTDDFVKKLLTILKLDLILQNVN